MIETKIKQRKLQKIGNSYFVSLPPCWIEHHNLKKKDFLEFKLTETDQLVICKNE